MQSQGNIRVVEMLRYLYQHTDENHTATVTDITAYLKERGIQAVRQTVYADLNALITAGFDIVIVKSTQNQYFIGSRLFEYPELKMLADAVASSKIISAKKSEALVQKLGCLTSIHQAEQLKGLASLSSRVKPGNEKVYYIIDSIHSAILEHRQIEFQYYEYTQTKEKILKHDGYRYLLDPYALEWKNDHYYLIGYSHKHSRVALKKKELPVHYTLESVQELGQKSVVLLEQIKTIDKRRILSYIGKVSREEMHAVDEALQVSLDIHIPEGMEAP